MKKIIFLIFTILFVVTIASAELWVCRDGDKLRRFQGDGVQLGIATPNHTTTGSINVNCIHATKQEHNLAGQPFKNLDKSVITGSRIVDKSQSEIDTILQFRADSKNISDTTAVNNLEISAKDLARALVQLGIVDGPTLKSKIKQIKGITP